MGHDIHNLYINTTIGWLKDLLMFGGFFLSLMRIR